MKLFTTIIYILLLLNLSKGNTHNNRFNNIALKDGLSHSLVTSLIEDNKGFIWIGTQDGINRYDGYSMKVFNAGDGNRNPKYNWTNSLFNDSHSQIWMLFDGEGVQRYDPEKEIFFNYTNNPNNAHSITGNKAFTPTNFSRIYEDSDSSVWIATASGLNRYNRDNDNFETFQFNPNDDSSISSNTVTYIIEDNRKILWIGTANGLNYYDLNKQKMFRFGRNRVTNAQLNDTSITCLLPLNDGSLLVGTFFNGINYIKNPLNRDKVTISYHLSESPNKNLEATVYSITPTNNSGILIAMHSGLYTMKENQNSISVELIKATKNIPIYHVFQDSLSNIWTSSKNTGDGIFKFNQNLRDYDFFTKDENNSYGFSTQKVQFIKQTSNGIIWIGTEKDGVFKYDLYAKEFGLIDDNPNQKININNNEVYSIFEDINNDLWVGTKNGLNRINLKTGTTKLYKKTDELTVGIDYNYSNNVIGNLVGVIKETPEHNLWLGYFDSKVSLYNPSTNSFLNFQHNKKNPNSFLSWSQRAICITKAGEVFFGSTDRGLCKLASDKKSFIYFSVNSGNYDGTNDLWINTIIEDEDEFMWIGTMTNGLNRYNKKNGRFRYFKKDPNNKLSIPSNQIRCILEPEIFNENILWIGTDNGFSKFNKTNLTFTNYSTNEGHSGNVIHGIIEDSKGKLWMSTNNGLINFDPITEKIHVYFEDDGIQGNEFNEGAYFKNSKGTLYFGGVNGVTFFNPDEIALNPFSPIVQITSFSLNNNLVLPGDTIHKHIILDKSITYEDEIILTHKDKIISFEFAALHFSVPTKIKYRYQLEGFDDEKIDIDYKKRFINYTNIPTGSYNLKIWATNNDGIWIKDPKILKIIMLPPFWERWWFISSVIIVVLLIFIFILNYRTSLLKKQRILLKLRVDEQTKELKTANQNLKTKQSEIIKHSDSLKETNSLLEKQKDEIQEMGEKLHKADEMKLRFFTNISHELRTPLTLILGPTEKLLAINRVDNWSSVKSDLKLIYKNEKRLLQLINQLLDIRQVETGTLKLDLQKADLILILNGIVELFQPLANQNNIKLNFISDVEKLELYVDLDKIEKIVVNLLSNAFKHAQLGGAISVLVNKNSKEKNVRITVNDSGKGISKNHLPHIFDRFYQISAKSESGQVGSGIGLSLCKDLVEIHKGTISVESGINSGTSFYVTISLISNIYKSKDFSESPDNKLELNYSKSMIDSPNEQNISLKNTNKTYNQSHTILVVEDNLDMSDFIVSSLVNDYQVLRAYDGVEGLKIAQKQLPDIIISDIMMPNMDGLEFCEKLKANIVTSHVPIILLTAKSEDEYQIQGLKLGADDYLTKPFNPEILKLKIKNTLELSKQIANKFSKDIDIIPSNIDISEIDHDLIERIVKFIEDNIDHPELNGDMLSSEMAMSKGNLYKKLKTLTGMTVNIYIRTIRLKIAAKLLKKGNYNITEVAYSVGFNNPKYFSTCFSELFSMSPKDYMAN